VGSQGELQSILDSATSLRGYIDDGKPTVKLQTYGVVTTQRLSLWADEDGSVVLSSWVAELKRQYQRFYPNKAAREGVLTLPEHGWTVYPMFHLAYRGLTPAQRWYPPIALSLHDYVDYWRHNLDRAGRKHREVITSDKFGRWLIDSEHINRAELHSLHAWLDSREMPLRQVDLRLTIATERRWPHTPQVPQVQAAANELLSALGEPTVA